MDKHLHFILAAALTGFLTLAATPLSAADLSQAKAQGWVGEQLDGYLGLVNANAPPDVKSLVDSINSQRHAEYERIARKNGVSPSEVGRLTAQKVIGQTPAGQYVQTPSGWSKR
ncbi:YdbL family protein [Methylococcus sp. EFPC2]|uniref:YdbL family protein n=1 Tax=Methylococcus sp. EFPC2 TaxID=2812648 RepID=UPI00196723DB|nr:YdbL family protein [Methylococcus sp. EFPC2]QSA97210.1 YdbL family protein [Methylococcus sp. EFPC2]